MTQVRQSIRGTPYEAAATVRSVPEAKAPSKDAAASSARYQAAGVPSTSPSVGTFQGLFKWVGKIREIKEAIEKSSREDFERAKESQDLILARDIIHVGGHGALLDDAWKKEVYVNLHRSPEAWLRAAEHHRERGDYLKALAHVEYALFIAQHEIRSSPAKVDGKKGDYWTISFLSKGTLDRPAQDLVLQRKKDLITEINGLEARLEERKLNVETISRTALDKTIRNQALAEYAKLSAVWELVGGVDGLQFKSINLDDLKRASKLNLLGGALYDNQKLLTVGAQIGIQLERHTQLEARESAVFETWLSLSPRNSRFAFDLEVATIQGPVGPFEMASPADVVENSPLLKVYRSLKHSRDPLAPRMEEIAADFKQTVRFDGEKCFDLDLPLQYQQTCSFDRYDPTVHDRIFTDHRRETPRNLAELTALNDGLDRKYGDDGFQQIVGKAMEGLKGEAADGISSIQEDLRGMGGLSGLLEKVRTHQITPEALESHRKLLISRGEKSLRFFEEKAKAYAKEEAKYLADANHEGMGRITRKFQRLEEEYKSVKHSLAVLDRLRSLGPIKEEGQIEVAAKIFRDSTGPVFAASETQMRSLLQDEAEELGKKGGSLREKLAAIRPFDPQSSPFSEDGFDSRREAADDLVDLHVKKYEELSTLLEAENLKHAVDDSITSFKHARSQSHRADLAEQFFKPFSDVDFSSDERFGQMIRSFESARKLLGSSDPTERERGANAARMLFGTSLGRTLQGKIRSSQWFDKWVVSPGVMIASAAASMTVLRFAGPILGRYLSGTTLARTLFWTNAASFTVSNNLLNAKVHGVGMGHALKSMVMHPGATLEEVAITGAMMHFLKPFQGAVSGFAEKTLGWKGLALKVLYPGDLAVEIGGLHVFNKGIVSLYQNLKNHGLKNSLKNTWSSLKDIDAAHDAGFLVFLHAGNLFTSPLLELVNRGAENLGARIAGLDPMKLALDAGIDRLVGALGDPSKLGHDDLPPLLDTLESAYRSQRAFLEKRPRDQKRVSDIEALNQNAQALQNVLQFREAYTRSVLLRVTREGARNRYGVTIHPSQDGLFKVTSYAATKGVELIRDLKADPAVTDIQIHDNGLIVVTLTDSLGQPMTWRMVDRGGALNLPGMRREIARGAKPIQKDEAPVPQNDNNEPAIFQSTPAKVAGAMGN